MQKVIEKSENPQTYYTVRRLCFKKSVPYFEEFDRTFPTVKEAEDYIMNHASVKMRNKTMRFFIDEVRIIEAVELV